MIGVILTTAGSVINAFVTAFVLVGLGVTLLVLVFLIFALLPGFLYRPAENYVGVIYRASRFARLADPDRWTVVIPGLHKVKSEVHLYVRRTPVQLTDLLTQDKVPVDCEFLVLYRLDLRRVESESLLQALRIPEEGWNSIVNTVLRSIALDVVGGINLDELRSPAGYQHLKWTLSALLADRLKGFGLLINADRGVTVQRVAVAEPIQAVITDESLAELQGKAALGRLLPLLDDLSQRDPAVVQAILRTTLASVAVKGDASLNPLSLADLLDTLTSLIRQRDETEAVGGDGEALRVILPNGGGRRGGEAA